MKTVYTKPELEIIEFSEADVITDSYTEDSRGLQIIPT